MSKEAWKDKVFRKLGDETIGEIDEAYLDQIAKEENLKRRTEPKKETKEKPVKEKPVKVKKEVKEKPKKKAPKTKKNPLKKVTSVASKREEGKAADDYNVLSALKIDYKTDIKNLITAKDVSKIKFTVSAPTGLDSGQVRRFCSNVEKNLYRYQKIIEKRDKDVITLAAEVSRLEQLLQEERYDSELTSLADGDSGNEDRLKEEIVDLKLKNRELQKQISQVKSE